jgi:hypothetical protein
VVLPVGWFSRRGTAAEDLVEESEAGYFDAELLRLVRRDRLGRETVEGRYLYTSAKPARRRQQIPSRRVCEAESVPGGAIPHVDVLPDELKACIVLLFSMRLYAGLEALKVGHGGDQAIAELLGLDLGRVARGRRQLLEGDVEPQRVRRTPRRAASRVLRRGAQQRDPPLGVQGADARRDVPRQR